MKLIILGLAAMFAQAQTTSVANHPSRSAWEVFARISAPSASASSRATWETWIAAEDVFPPHPNKPPIWPSDGMQPKRFKVSLQDVWQAQDRERFALRQGLRLTFPRRPKDAEVRMNREAFDFIVKENLYYVEGQIARAKDDRRIQFPDEAILVKARWKPIDSAQQSRYHTAKADGKLWGLAALHITTKQLPNWFWATWEHEDNEERCLAGCIDNFGFPNEAPAPSPELKRLFGDAGLPPEWFHYRLAGAQTDFIDSQGVPVRLGNSFIERGTVLSSSCMTCHSRAAFNSSRAFLDTADALSSGFIGVPRFGWFLDSNLNTVFLQSDFVWSLKRANYRDPLHALAEQK